MIVVGSANSSNTVRLVDVALEAGAKVAKRVDGTSELNDEMLDGVSTVGLSSGASVPEILVKDVLAWLAERGYSEISEIETSVEKLTFALPPELRRDIKGSARVEK